MKYLLVTTLFLSSLSSFAEPTRVIGEDTRVKITDKNAKDAHDSIGMLIMKFGKNTGMCTGTVIGTRSVVTAAHCLYDHKYGMADSVQFVPSLREALPVKKLPQGIFTASKLRVLSKYIKSASNTDDLGLVTFEENLPVKALSVRVAASSDKQITIAGYPGDKKDGELWEGTGKRFPHLFESNPDSYNVDTYSGQSGSAIRVAGDTIIGIHSGGTRNYFYEYNMGFFFKKDTLATIKKWIEEDK